MGSACATKRGRDQRDYGAVVNQHGLQLLFDLVIALVRGLGLVVVASPTQALNHEVYIYPFIFEDR